MSEGEGTTRVRSRRLPLLRFPGDRHGCIYLLIYHYYVSHILTNLFGSYISNHSNLYASFCMKYSAPAPYEGDNPQQRVIEDCEAVPFSFASCAALYPEPVGTDGVVLVCRLFVRDEICLVLRLIRLQRTPMSASLCLSHLVRHIERLKEYELSIQS